MALIKSKYADVEWLRGLPKCELHLHLEGTIEPETLVELSIRHDPIPFTLEKARALYQTTTFLDFLRAFGMVSERLQTAEDYELITYRMIQALSLEGVRHAEVYISFADILKNKPSLSLDDVMDSIEKARMKGQQTYGVSIYWIPTIVRQHDMRWALAVVDNAVRLRSQYSSIVCIGIGGNELAGPAELFVEPFAIAKRNGLHVKIHAGEDAGPESIWKALVVGAERIGHGVTAVKDAELIEHLKEIQMPIEMSVTSNFCTGSWTNIDAHPIRQFFDAGLLVTVNSDDPAMFRSNLLEEYVLLQEKLQFTTEELRQLARNSITASFLDSNAKQRLLIECDRYK